MDRIVVGFDGSDMADAAVRIAVAEARRRSAAIEVVYAWSRVHRSHRVPDAAGQLPAVADDEGAVARRWVADRLADLIDGGHPPVEVRVTVVEDDVPARAIVRAADGAAAVVVGSRQLTGYRGEVLGSVSQRVVAESPCPVLVVPAPVAEADLAAGDLPPLHGLDD
jgi:nucleotide-binding universal stress UspA family protein